MRHRIERVKRASLFSTIEVFMEEAVSTGPAAAIYTPCRELASVSAEELGFALSFFVAAAGRRLGAMDHMDDKLSGPSLAACQRVLADLLHGAPRLDKSRLLPQQTTLSAAFALLWKHYEEHAACESICARVVCFHFLMESTNGDVVRTWTTACSEDPEHILLDPAVVEGLASVPLLYEEGLVESRFRSAIEHAHHTRCS